MSMLLVDVFERAADVGRRPTYCCRRHLTEGSLVPGARIATTHDLAADVRRPGRLLLRAP